MVTKFKNFIMMAGFLGGLIFGQVFLPTMANAFGGFGNGTMGPELGGPPAPPLLPSVPPPPLPPLSLEDVPAPAGSSAVATNYIQPTYTAFLGLGITLLLVPVAKNWLWPGVKWVVSSVFLDHLGVLSLPRLFRPVREGVDWHNLGRWRSSESCNIRDLFKKPRPNPRTCSLLECWSDALVGTSCDVYPVVSGRKFKGEGELVMGYQYDLTRKKEVVVSVIIVRRASGAEEPNGLRADQKKVFHLLHRDLSGKATTIQEVKRQYVQPFVGSAAEPYYRFTRGRVVLVEAAEVPSDRRAAAELPPVGEEVAAGGAGAVAPPRPSDVEAKRELEKFHGDLSRVFDQANVGSLLHDTLFNMYSTEDSFLELNTRHRLAHLSLDLGGKSDVRFDLYFVNRKVQQAQALPAEAADR